MMFSVSKEDSAKIDTWLKKQIYPSIVEKQKQDPNIAQFLFAAEDGTVYPYGGAIGGECTYNFTPTSLGTVFTVTHSSGQTLDLTNYEDW